MILPLARKLGDAMGLDPIPEVEPITQTVWRAQRRDLWSPEALAEMKRIWDTPDPFDAAALKGLEGMRDG